MRRHRLLCVVPPAGELATLGVGQQLDLADAAPGVGYDCEKQPFEAPHQRDDGLPLEQVGAELDIAFEAAGRAVAVAGLGQTERQVELRPAGVERLLLDIQAGQVQVGLRGALQHQHHLEERVPVCRTARVEHLDEAVEREVLVCEGCKVSRPDPVHELAEARVSGSIGAQHQGVHEEPDQLVERLVGPARERGAQWDVCTRAEPAEQCGQTGLHHHEQRGLVLPGQSCQRAVEFGVEPHRQRLAASAGDRWSRTVRG